MRPAIAAMPGPLVFIFLANGLRGKATIRVKSPHYLAAALLSASPQPPDVGSAPLALRVRARGLNRSRGRSLRQAARLPSSAPGRPVLKMRGYQPQSRQEHPHDRRGYQPIAPAHDRRHDDPQSKYPPAKPGALVLEPLKAACPCRTRQSVPSTLWNAPHLMTC